MEKVLSVIDATFLLDGVLDAVHTVTLTGRRSRGGTFLYAHRSSSIIRSPASVGKAGRVAVKEKYNFLKAGLKLWVDESVYDGIHGGVAKEKPVKRYLKSWVYCGEFSVCSGVEQDVKSSTPDGENADQQTDNHSKHGHCSSYLLTVHSTLQRCHHLRYAAF